MQYEYFKFWNWRNKEPRFPLSENEAKEWHAKEKPYTVAVKDNGSIKYAVQVNFNIYFCNVLFDYGESFITEAYTIEHNQLFLRNIKKRNKNDLITFLYEPDGKARKDIFGENSELLDTIYEEIDVSKHFRNMIEFGNYESILPNTPDKIIVEF